MRATAPGEAADGGAPPLFSRQDAGPLAALVALTLALEVGAALLGARAAGIPLSHLGAHFDGFLYIEIAKSFPLPFGPGAIDYAGQAPGYPALLWLGRVVSGGTLDWGTLALLATWLPGALVVVAFYAACRAFGLRPFWPSLLLVVAHPRWLAVAAPPHPEPLTLCFALSALVAARRARPGLAMGLLSGAVATRYPALLLLPAFALHALLARPRPALARLSWLGLPVGVFLALNLYLWLRVPGFEGVFEAHRVHWDTHFTWPFAALLEGASREHWGSAYPTFEVTYATLLLYLLSVPLGLRSSQRDAWMLPAWVAAVVLFHASLSGALGVWDFARLTILAWPACLLILWRAIGERIPRAVCLLLAAGLGAFSFQYARHAIHWAVALQREANAPLFEATIQRLDDDQPHWMDFRAMQRERARTRRPPQ